VSMGSSKLLRVADMHWQVLAAEPLQQASLYCFNAAGCNLHRQCIQSFFAV
jgi:hypothetical protein